MRLCEETTLRPCLSELLLQEAEARGLTSEQNRERILFEHAKTLVLAAMPEDIVVDIRTPAEGRAWILSRNPHCNALLPARLTGDERCMKVTAIELLRTG